MHKFPQLTGNNVPGFRFPPTCANSCATVKKKKKKREKDIKQESILTPHSADSLPGEAFNYMSTQLADRPIAWPQLPCKMC